jgi:hypothetical protein
MSWPGCSDQLFSESLLFYVSARRYHYPIDWTGVGLIVSWSGKREGDSTKGPLPVFFFGQGEIPAIGKIAICFVIAFENHNDHVSILRF